MPLARFREGLTFADFKFSQRRVGGKIVHRRSLNVLRCLNEKKHEVLLFLQITAGQLIHAGELHTQRQEHQHRAVGRQTQPWEGSRHTNPKLGHGSAVQFHSDKGHDERHEACENYGHHNRHQEKLGEGHGVFPMEKLLAKEAGDLFHGNHKAEEFHDNKTDDYHANGLGAKALAVYDVRNCHHNQNEGAVEKQILRENHFTSGFHHLKKSFLKNGGTVYRIKI